MKAEMPVVFECAGERLIGIHHPGAETAEVGVIVVIGGPQYRVGSHRQFVVTARFLAAAGIPVLRFDYRGMGDSEGSMRTFESVDNDIRAAVTCLQQQQTALRKFVLLGLCDAASAILMYGSSDDRVAGLVLFNPWVRTEQGEAKAYIKHYYWQRLLQRSFWKKLVAGKLNIVSSIRQFLGALGASRKPVVLSTDCEGVPNPGFIERMRSGLRAFCQPILIIISGHDLTAQEFADLCRTNKGWEALTHRSSVTWANFPDADHTMSAKADLSRANAKLIDWLSRSIVE